MDDLISRQAAIDALDGEITVTGRVNAEAVRGYANLVCDRIKRLPSAQPEPQWIPVSERLPEEGQMCLVCDGGAIGIDTYIGHGNPYNWKWYMRDYDAWMPLPDPYKEEER